MRNIWQIVVGIVVVGGIAIALFNALDDGMAGDDAVASAPAATPSAAAATTPAGGGEAAGESGQVAQATAPKPETTFANIEITSQDFTLGRPDAPVTIIEYASLTCPHCARFHNNVLPTVKKDYVETGKVRLVYRDFPLDRIALAAAMLARCSGRDRFFGFIDMLYKSQPRWSRSSNPIESLGQIARLGGITPEAFDACMKNTKMQESILKQRMEASRKFKITATPTIFINGGKYSSLEVGQLRAVVESILPKT